MKVVYFSSASENTHRFVQKLGVAADRIPLRGTDPGSVDTPYVLVTPTYGGGSQKGAVPKQVIRFLNIPRHRSYLRGVVAAGNSNFGAAFGLAGRIIAAKCDVPMLDQFELLGTADDVVRIRERLTQL